MSKCVCMPPNVHGSQRKILNVLLYHFHPIPLRQESLPEAGARLTASHTLESSYVCPHSSAVTGILTH